MDPPFLYWLNSRLQDNKQSNSVQKTEMTKYEVKLIAARTGKEPSLCHISGPNSLSHA